MESFSQRESVLLGYDLHRSSASHVSTSLKTQFGNSEFDFKDVFGGPPRRFSHQEMRNGLGETEDSKGLRSEDDLPAFGDDGMSRRRHTSNDFFDDIFGGNDSLTSSPRNSFSPATASRVSSPVRPLPPRADTWSTSVPAQFSLPAKLIKGTDLPTFGSSGRNHHKTKDNAANGASSYAFSPLSRFSSKAPEGLSNDVSRQSSLLEELSLSGEENLAQPVEADKGIDLKNSSSNSSEIPANDSQFHFSIYKWASKGAPFAMSLRRGSKSRSLELCKLQRCSSANGWISCEDISREVAKNKDIEFPSSSSHMPSKVKSTENASHLDTSIESGGEEYRNSAETLRKTELNPGKDRVTVENVPADAIFHGSTEGTLFSSLPDKGSSGKTEEKVSVTRNEAQKSQIKTLRSLLRDKNHEQDAEDVTAKNGLKESKVKSSKKISAVFDSSENLEVEETDIETLSSEVNNRVRGKVKAFVKIFNQETSNKPKFDVHSQNQSSKWRERSKLTTTGAASVTTARANEKNNMLAANKNDKPDASISVKEYFKESEKLHPETKTTKHHKPADISAGLNDSSAASSVPEVSRTSVGDANEPGHFLITELTQMEVKKPETGADHETIQDLQVKIKKWSNGKEGNIRALLSTLQYVLWSESGWKSVPLVDIIEGNAVKRSYQKALLCLHPDKLQQKGATADQKYIAEKVFGVLQEAWDHFNSLGAV